MIMLRGEGGKENQSFLFPQREALPSTAVKGSESSRRSGTENRVYLAFRVAAPGVDVPRGGQGQRVLGAHGDVLDEDPGQQWYLLRPVVVAGTALGQPNQAICKDKHQAPGASSTQGGFHYRHKQGRNRQQFCTVLGSGHRESFRDKGHRYSLQTTAAYSACLHC